MLLLSYPHSALVCACNAVCVHASVYVHMVMLLAEVNTVSLWMLVRWSVRVMLSVCMPVCMCIW